MSFADKVKKNKWASASAIVGLIVSVITAVWLFEDRYFTTAKAVELENRTKTRVEFIEQQIVQSLQQFQMRQDSILLDDLYRRKALYEHLMRQFPNNEDLKREYESINEEIEMLRDNIIKHRNPTG